LGSNIAAYCAEFVLFPNFGQHIAASGQEPVTGLVLIRPDGMVGRWFKPGMSVNDGFKGGFA
jgi:hypothetical protein